MAHNGVAHLRVAGTDVGGHRRGYRVSVDSVTHAFIEIKVTLQPSEVPMKRGDKGNLGEWLAPPHLVHIPRSFFTNFPGIAKLRPLQTAEVLQLLDVV